jgi:molecular chaperone HtpG
MGNQTIKTGKQILDIITSGMYSNPLMVLREYVQNASDAIDLAILENKISRESGRIDVEVNSLDREISIADNGIGIPLNTAANLLFSIGVSSKNNGNSRGFRGIGRLGGLGYCDEIIFETRSNKNDPVFIAIWNGKLLRQICRDSDNDDDLSQTIISVAKKEKREATNKDPSQFFKVKMKGVHKFYKDELMNITTIKEYLSRVAPVSFDKRKFPFSTNIEKNLSEIDGYRSYNLFVNNEPVYKPHSAIFAIGGQATDEITDIQCFDIKGRNEEIIGRGWFAKSGFKASLIQSESMRGIRIRQGNIEVGDEYFLAESFSERRFSTWAIGEIHFNYSLRLNARRDGFEQSPEFEAFLEQASLLCRHISGLCRTASKERSKNAIENGLIKNIADSLETAVLTKGHHRNQAIRMAKELIDKSTKIKTSDKKLNDLKECIPRIENETLSLANLLDGRILRGIDSKTLLENVAESVAQNYQLNKTASELIKAIIEPYIRKEVKLKELWD